MAHLQFNGLALSLLPFLVTLSMLMDRAGCYNVREKKLIVRQLTSTVNSFGIATFSAHGEGLRFFDSLKCINTIFRGFSNDYNGFTTSEIAQMVHFFRDGDKRSAEKIYAFFDFLKCMNTIFPGFQMTITVLQHQRLHKWFTFSALGESPGAAGDRGKLE